MELPNEIVENFLMKSDVDDIVAYCLTDKRAQETCNSLSFWNQKSIRDFGLPLSLLCSQSYYWQYKLLRNIADGGYLLGMLLRGGMMDLAEKYVEENDLNEIITIAIQNDDIVVLNYLKDLIGDAVVNSKNFTRLRDSFVAGSSRAVKFFLNFAFENYVLDPVGLSVIYDYVRLLGDPKSIPLLHPYIVEFYHQKGIPPGISDKLKEYIQTRIQS